MMEVLEFLFHLIALPAGYVALVEIIDRLNRMGRR